MYKLVALDMDGTLLNEDKKISLENMNAINNAKKTGVKVVLATGRPLNGIKRYLEELDLVNEDDYAVAFNGALVQNTRTGEVVAKNLMTLEDLKYLYNLSRELDVNIHFLSYDACYTPKINQYSILESEINGIGLIEQDFEHVDANTTIVKIMFVDPEAKLEKAISSLPKEVHDKYTIVRSAPFFLEFINKKVNKGFGVKVLAETLGINQDEVICMGDAGNDVHMIQYAGLGVAMGNAFPEVKDIADYVTKTNEEHGVAHVINKFVLKNDQAS